MQNTLNGPDRDDIIIPLFIIGMQPQPASRAASLTGILPYFITFSIIRSQSAVVCLNQFQDSHHSSHLGYFQAITARISAIQDSPAASRFLFYMQSLILIPSHPGPCDASKRILEP